MYHTPTLLQHEEGNLITCMEILNMSTFVDPKMHFLGIYLMKVLRYEVKAFFLMPTKFQNWLYTVSWLALK